MSDKGEWCFSTGATPRRYKTAAGAIKAARTMLELERNRARGVGEDRRPFDKAIEELGWLKSTDIDRDRRAPYEIEVPIRGVTMKIRFHRDKPRSTK